MISFLDGPAQGELLMLRRAPLVLRVVRSPSGKWDALDMLDDEPKPREEIFVYVRASKMSRYHIRCSPRSASGHYMRAEYRLYGEQPADREVRSTDAWRAWSQARAAELMDLHVQFVGARKGES